MSKSEKVGKKSAAAAAVKPAAKATLPAKLKVTKPVPIKAAPVKAAPAKAAAKTPPKPEPKAVKPLPSQVKPKPEPKAAVKPAAVKPVLATPAKATAKPAEKPATKAAAKPAEKPAPKATAKPEAKSEPKSAPKSEPKSEPKSAAKPAKAAEAAAPKPVAKPAPEPVAKAQAPRPAPAPIPAMAPPAPPPAPPTSHSGVISGPMRPMAPPRAMAKAEIFVDGDYVVYPTHGVGKVERIATEEIAGHTLELIHITFDENRMKLRVPTNKARTAGLRKLASAKQFSDVLATLKGRARIKRTMWSRRAQEYEAKINSGDPQAIAEVVRDLHRNAGQPDQSFSERQIYESALDRLAAEYGALEKLDKATAIERLIAHLKSE
ncbi:MAG: CarD family transcriptional regulator [Acidocella sp.]|nr:CarD family transcriptional regulator [Acidocella sp.]